MTERQLEIHKGLKAIGPEIAQFYLDGLDLIESNLGTKSNLLAHILREIDGGLRDIFEQKQLKEEFQKKLKNEDLQKVFDQFKEDYKNFDYLGDITFEDFKKAKGHISSVLVSFGFSFDHPLSAQYIKVVRWLAKYAHRSGAYNEPRNPKDIINLWNEFEDVLSKLIGNYYALAERIDLILKLTEPTQEILKTLPNLLNTESRFVYFFNGLQSTKWLQALEAEGYFDGAKNPEPIESEENPGFFSMPYWGVLTYLETVAQKNLESPEKETSESLLRIIDGICQYKNPQEQRTENYRTDYTVFKIICTIPQEYLHDQHFVFIKDALQSRWDGLIGHSFNVFLERLISLGNKKLLLKGVQLLLTYRIFEDNFEKVHSIFRSFELQSILSEFKDSLIPSIGKEMLQFTLQVIDEVVEHEESAFNNISIPAIEDHEQTSFPEKYDCQLVYLVRDILERLNSNEILEILKVLIVNRHPINRRLAIHTIRVRYDEFKELFWGLGENPLSIPLAKHEVYELLKVHSEFFSTQELNQVIDWIKTKEYYIPEETKGDEEIIAKSVAYRQKEWLSSLVPSGSEVVTKLMGELSAINNAIVKHPGFDSWHSSLTGNISPLKMGDILKLNIEELIAFYNGFINKDHDFMGPSVDGLIDMFSIAVRKKPQKYSIDCSLLIDAPSPIKYSWMKGLGESWREEDLEFDCAEVFQVVKSILQKDIFWESHNNNDNYSRWFVSNLLSFIEDGVRDDSHAFEEKQLPIIKEILFVILSRDNYPVFDYSDISMTALNNSKGKVYVALLQYSLRLARIENIENNRWDGDVKKIISQKIKQNEENPLLYHAIGQFLPNIHYLDEKWMIENFEKLFPIDSETNWAASINGYFFYHRRPNRIHFRLFLEGSHFQKAILHENIKGEAKNSLIQQICTAYLYEFESIEIDKEAIQSLIQSNSENVFSSLIHFFWNPRFPFESKVIHKIKPLWVKLYNKAIKLENKELDSYILSGCCKWLNSVSHLDEEIFEILITSVAYISQRDKYSLIDALSKHINNTPENVGLILIELFKKEVSYDISRGKLREMIEIIFEKGYKDIGNKICLMHAEDGYHFLRDLYIKYNS